jgi:hypothetical protein
MAVSHFLIILMGGVIISLSLAAEGRQIASDFDHEVFFKWGLGW